jgi:hypothetical protein
MLNIFFSPENRAVYEEMWKNYGTVRQATHEDTWLCRCDLLAGELRQEKKHTHDT